VVATVVGGGCGQRVGVGARVGVGVGEARCARWIEPAGPVRAWGARVWNGRIGGLASEERGTRTRATSGRFGCRLYYWGGGGLASTARTG
jgi:hypothetical protein